MAGKPENTNKKKDGPKNSNNLYWIYALILLFIIFATAIFPTGNDAKESSYRMFRDTLVQGHLVENVMIWQSENLNEVDVYLTTEALSREKYKTLFPPGTSAEKGPHYSFNVGSTEKLEEFLVENRIVFDIDKKSDFLGSFGPILFPILIIVAIWIFFMRRIGGGGPGGQIFNIGKSKASLYDKENKVNVTFDDVAGLEEAKVEVMEVVEFLKNPQKFTRLGGHLPKGVLLVGPPGTGKTLMAKAVAGEAKVPFFSISGSDFVEMFVGVGAARVRDLFKQAKEKAPCIVFIDEIDAVGRSRGRNNITGGNDERENTLNQLLVEMDGFNSDSGVILMAATNRPDVLDPALLRPGRFDRQIGIDRPDIVGREQIFKVHLKNIKLKDTVKASELAAQTPGFVGADIANVCNEAALIAARRNKEGVEMEDFQDAIDRSIGGLEKKNKIISPDEKKIIAYHEAGHAVAGWFLEHAYPLVKVSIVPRGIAALGYAQYLPKEQYLYTTEQLIDQMCMTLGGRVAEDIIFGRISTGAQNDLERITQMAYAMVTVYGMNSKVGNLSFADNNQEYTFTKPYSDSTAEMIDEEVRKLVDSSYARVKKLLTERMDALEALAQQLLKKEVLFKEDLVQLIGPRPFESSETAEDNGSATEKVEQGENGKAEKAEDSSEAKEEEGSDSKTEDEKVSPKLGDTPPGTDN